MLYGEELKEICTSCGIERDNLPDGLYSTLLNKIKDKTDETNAKLEKYAAFIKKYFEKTLVSADDFPDNFDMGYNANLRYAFQYQSLLKSTPPLRTEGVEMIRAAFQYCSALKTIPNLNLSSATDVTYLFYYCSALESITFAGLINIDLDLHYSTLLTHDSLLSAINALAQTTEAKTLTLGTENLAKLTTEEKEMATGKGWTLA